MTYRELLSNNKKIRDLTLVQFIAYFGAWFSNVAIYTMLVKFGASAILIASVTAMHLLPAVIIAPFSGAFIDTIDRKKLMVFLLICELICTLGFLLIDSLDLVWLLMILVFIRMGASSMFFSCEMSILPHLVESSELQKANEIHSIIWSFTYAFGMAVGGVVVNSFGIKTSFIIDALFFIVAIFVFSKIDFELEINKHKERFFRAIADGFNYIRKHKLVLHLILLHSSVGLTAFDSLITLLADYNYKYVIAVPLSIGISNAIRALALMIGPFVVGNLMNKQRLFYLLIFQGLGIIIWAFLQFNFYLALIGLFLTGFATTTLWSYTYALIQENIERKYLGRVISYNDMIFMISNVATTFFIGFMADFISLKAITICIGCAFFIVAIYYKRILKWI